MGCLVFLKVRSGHRVENGLRGDEGVRVFPQHGGGGSCRWCVHLRVSTRSLLQQRGFAPVPSVLT